MNLGIKMDWKVLLKKLRAFKLPILLPLIIIIFFEYVEYSLTPLIVWPKISHGFTDSIKILIVGDPQLLGYRFTPPSIVGFIYRWDADRYVKKTFSLAHNYMKPDIVLFLGDNFDEGEIATDADFVVYFKRFQHIFKDTDFKKAIIVPGDNDIGGESQPPQLDMERRFDTYFRNDVYMHHKFLEFVKINYITHSNQYQVVKNISENAFRIILTHFPLTPSYSSFVRNQVIPFVQPHIILSAHDHKYQHVISDRKTGIIVQTPSTKDFVSKSFNISDLYIHEIVVPTCSYRMGTHKMGYGVLEISKSKEVTYSILWLPSRFRQLWTYLFILSCVLLYVFALLFRTALSRKNSQSIQRRTWNSML